MRIHLFLLTLLLATLPPSACRCFAAALRPQGTAETLGYHPGDTLLRIPTHARQIPPFAFAGIPGLKHIVFPSDSKCLKIGDFAFAHCPDLQSVALPENLKHLGTGAFRECPALRYLNFPVSLAIIPKEACHRCESLSMVSLPENLREIAPFAFAGCSNLSTIAWQDSPTASPENCSPGDSIPLHATSGILSFPPSLRTIGNNAFSSCHSITSALLPPGLALLDSYAFSDCTALESVTLPANDKMLGELIFDGCTALHTISIPSPAPPYFDCDSAPFDPLDTSLYNQCALRVPQASAHLYRRDYPWRLFHNILPIP